MYIHIYLFIYFLILIASFLPSLFFHFKELLVDLKYIYNFSYINRIIFNIIFFLFGIKSSNQEKYTALKVDS